jgi:hypothetical protein
MLPRTYEWTMGLAFLDGPPFPSRIAAWGHGSSRPAAAGLTQGEVARRVGTAQSMYV